MKIGIKLEGAAGVIEIVKIRHLSLLIISGVRFDLYLNRFNGDEVFVGEVSMMVNGFYPTLDLSNIALINDIIYTYLLTLPQYTEYVAVEEEVQN